MPSIGEINQIIGIPTSKDIKRQIPSIINDEDSTEKILQNHDYLIKKKIKVKKREDFIVKNVQEAKLHLKNQQWMLE